MAVASQVDGLLRHENFYSALLRGQIADHAFEGITVLNDEKQRLIANLNDKNLLNLRNHGLLSCGRSIPEAYQNLWALQRACEVQITTDACGKDITPIPRIYWIKPSKYTRFRAWISHPANLSLTRYNA